MGLFSFNVDFIDTYAVIFYEYDGKYRENPKYRNKGADHYYDSSDQKL